MYKFSVLVCTYNSTWKELKDTLDSIICQTLDGIEIIVADDGSKQNYEAELRAYFDSVEFNDYVLLLHSQNRGTVKNMLSGSKAARGIYIKPIGAGDRLLQADSLEKMYHFMDKRDAKCAFSDLLIFSWQEEEQVVLPQTLPLDKGPYHNGHATGKSMENIIVYNDHISGASLFYEKQCFVEKLQVLKDVVIYMEDLMQYLLLLDGEPIYYFAEACIAYEVGTGISTLQTVSNNQRMIKDQQSFLKYLCKNYGDNPYVKRRGRLEEIQQKECAKIVKVLMKCLAEPGWLRFRLKQRRMNRWK